MSEQKPPAQEQVSSADPPDEAVEKQVDELLDESARILDEARAAVEEQTPEIAPDAGNDEQPADHSVAVEDVNSAEPASTPEPEAAESTTSEAAPAPSEPTHTQQSETEPSESAPKIEEVDQQIAKTAGEAIKKEDEALAAAPAPPPAAPTPPKDQPSSAPAADEAPESESPAAQAGTEKTENPEPPAVETKPADASGAKTPDRLAKIAHRAQAIEKRIEALPFMPLLSRLVRKGLALINSPWENLSANFRMLLITIAAANAGVAVFACLIALWRLI